MFRLDISETVICNNRNDAPLRKAEKRPARTEKTTPSHASPHPSIRFAFPTIRRKKF